MFSEDQIKEFIDLHEKEFGFRISPEEAERYATQLIGFLRAVYQDSEKDKPPP